VDDHALFLEGIAGILEGQPDFCVVAAVRSFAEAKEELGRSPVDVLLLDFDLGCERATPFVHELMESAVNVRILIVTAGVAEVEAVQLIRAGVAGIFHKHNGSQALCQAVRQVAGGQPYLEQNYLPTLFNVIGPQRGDGPPRLSEREAKMLRLIFEGLVNKEIAGKLGMSESGVKSALRALFEKIGVKTRSQAVRVALEQYNAQL